jgi:hypothetical protein
LRFAPSRSSILIELKAALESAGIEFIGARADGRESGFRSPRRLGGFEISITGASGGSRVPLED